MDTPRIVISCSVITVSVLAGLWYLRKLKRERIPRKWVPVGRVSELLMYPLKSGYRMPITEAECTVFGFKQISDKAVYKLQDRFLVTYKESDNEFRTGRTHPKLVHVTVTNHDANHVALDAPGMRTLYVEIPDIKEENEKKILKFNLESVEMIDLGDEASSWISRYILEKESGLRLGFHDQSLKNRNITGDEYKYYPNLKDNDMGLFSDLSAFLLMNKSSIDDLNTRLTTPVTAHQFRPNIIVENAVAYAEDNWRWLKIGNDAIFYSVKPCTRCIFTTVDPETAIRSDKREPLKTLEKYRQIPDLKEREVAKNSPILGINLGLRKPGIIRSGDILYVGVR